MNPRHLFVVGRPRSSTSLIVRLLDSHPDFLTINSETIFYAQAEATRQFQDTDQRFFHLVGRPYDHERNTPLAFGVDVVPDRNWHRHKFYEDLLAFYPHPARCESLLREVAFTGPGAAMRCLFSLYQEAFPGEQEAQYLVEKTPEHERHIDQIREDFPGAVFLHMIRDPFDVIASRSKGAKQRNYMWEALLWRQSVEIFVRNKREFPDSHFAIRFEDLVGDTQSVMRKLAQTLGVDFSENLLAPTDHRGASTWQSNTHRADLPKNGVVDARFTFRNVEEDLSPAALDTIGSWLGRAYGACGFERHQDHLRPIPRFTAGKGNIARLVYAYLTRILIGDFRYFGSAVKVI